MMDMIGLSGLFDVMSMSGALWSGVIPGPGLALWGMTMAALIVSATALGLSGARWSWPRPVLRRLQVARAVEAH